YDAVAKSRREVTTTKRRGIAWSAWGVALIYTALIVIYMGLGGYNQALLARPGAREALGGAIAAKNGDSDGALAHLQSALSENPNNAVALVNISLVHLRRGDAAEALDAATKAIELDPELAVAHNNRAAALLRRGDVTDALAAASRAVELDPKLAIAHNNRAAALIGLQKYDESLQASDAAVRLDP